MAGADGMVRSSEEPGGHRGCRRVNSCLRGCLDFLNRHGWIIAFGVTAFALVLRARGFAEFYLNPDEGIDYLIVKTREANVSRGMIAGHAHPVLY